MIVFGAIQDTLSTSRDLRAWRNETDGDFQLHVLAGDHHFYRTDHFLAELKRSLSKVLVAKE